MGVGWAKARGWGRQGTGMAGDGDGMGQGWHGAGNVMGWGWQGTGMAGDGTSVCLAQGRGWRGHGHSRAGRRRRQGAGTAGTSLVTPRPGRCPPLPHFQLVKNCLKRGVSRPWGRISTCRDGDRDGVTSPMPAPGEPLAARTHLRPGRVAQAGDDLLGHFQGRLPLLLVGLAPCGRGRQSHAAGGPCPRVSHPASPSPGTFPDVDLPAGAVVQHEAVIGAEQALAEGAARGHLGQVHAPRRVRHLPAVGTSPWGHPGVPWPCPAPCPPWPCPAPYISWGYHSMPQPCPAIGPPWCPLAMSNLI